MSDNVEVDPTGPARMTTESLSKFVDDFVSGRVWSTAHTPEGQDALLPFPILKLAGLPEALDPKKIGLVWEYLDQASPLAVNEMPQFFSCRMMHIEDWERVVLAVETERARRKNISV